MSEDPFHSHQHVPNPNYTHNYTHNIPLSSSEQDLFLEPPRAPGMYYPPSNGPTPQGSPNNSSTFLPLNGNGGGGFGAKKERDFYSGPTSRGSAAQNNSKKKWLIIIGVAVLVVAAGVVLALYFAVIRPKNHPSSSSNSNPSNNSTSNPKTAVAITGSDGSDVKTEDGSSFTYTNKFGGYWVDDPANPFNNGARPNSWTPPLNESWTWGKDRVYGVNIGGLFVLEPFITPALFQKYPGVEDEFGLSLAMAKDTASGGLNQLEEHYKTFITEKDIADIAGAGLNWIRLPIPYWAIDVWEGEPFLAKTSWKYIVRLLGWARKYGLRVNLDLHTIPGSENGYNHSGKVGSINFLNGVMGVANAQRALNYIRIITEFISQDEYKDVVPLFSIVNEAFLDTIGKDSLTSFYLEAHKMIREITGIGKGPYIAIGDGFNTGGWDGFLPNSDRIILDAHPYFAFSGIQDQPINTGTGDAAGGQWPKLACNTWGKMMSNARKGFGVTIAGEFSNGFNDCGLFLRGTKFPAVTKDCTLFEDSSKWDDSVKQGLQAFIESSMDALGDWFFWTWKIGNSTKGIVEAPLWSYKLGLDGGWMPKDPREATGKCARIGAPIPAYDGVFQPWQTGGPGAGQIATEVTAQFPWPPASLRGATAAPTLLPMYTPTGAITTLPPPSFPSATPSPTLDGWADDKDQTPLYTAIAGCSYPPTWDAVNIPVPSQCGAPAAPARRNSPGKRRTA